jgi:hypothetical protein
LSTIRSQIKARLIAALNAAEKPSGTPACVDGLALVMSSSDLPSISLFLKSDQAENVGGSSGALKRRTAAFDVEVRTADAGGVTAFDLAEIHLKWLSKAVASVSTSSPTRIMHYVEEGVTSWENVGEGEIPVCLATMEVIAHYQTKVTDPEAWA